MGKKEVECEHCGYKWETKSQMFFVNCPRCRKQVNINGTGKNNKISDGTKVYNA